jgi:hypothetical protein
MMTDEKLTDAVNRSGFPLQIGLEHLVQANFKDQWKVIYSEHSWQNPFDSSSGFIDLIVEDIHKTTVLVVEAKKVVDASWIFLVSQDAQMKRRQAKSWVTYPASNHFDYAELTAVPDSVESKFCVVDGQDPKSRPMLERLASEVVSSTEGFAAEEKPLLQKTALRMYFSVIVTTATLKVCKTDPANISVATGQVEKAELQEVPYLRFRKQLNYNISPNFNYSNVAHADVARQKENTVFVVNSNCFLKFLAEFNVDDNSLNPIMRGH